MVSVCTVPARGGRLCERFGGYKTINRIPYLHIHMVGTRIFDLAGTCQARFLERQLHEFFFPIMTFWG